MKKIGFVTPWYGKDIPGGAEMELRGVVCHLHQADLEVEVLTTCAKDFTSDWYINYHKPGLTVEEGIPVRRFLVNRCNEALFVQLNAKILKGIPVTEAEESAFLDNIVNSTSLYNYMEEHQEEYSLFVFIPYMFGTTYHGALTCLRKAVLIPCLHDECYAYFSRFRKCFSRVNGIVYNAEPERKLANRLYHLKNVNQITMGIGMDTDITGDAERFRKKYQIESPFVLYAGRKDRTKNVHTLLTYFERYKKEYHDQLKLVLIGPGSLPIPQDIMGDVQDLGFIPIQDKYDAYAAAEVLCQPSKNESFSFVIMESWLMGRPVMVHEECDVTSNFVKESNGGFYFRNYEEFSEEINYLLDHKEQAYVIGRQGREYVLKHFSWEVIVQKYKEFLELCAACADSVDGGKA